MNQQTASAAEILWGQMVEADTNFSIAFRAFFSEGVDRVPTVRAGLRSGGMGQAVALRVFPYLDISERMRLFSDLVFLASAAHGSIDAVRHQILLLPREWVLETIEQEAEPLLRQGTYDEYRRFLELYELLGARDLVRRLALRAAASPDPDIREAGEDYPPKGEPAGSKAAT